MKAKYYCLDSSRSLVRLLLANITYFFSHILNNVFLLHLHNLAIAYSPITPDCLERKPSILNSACCAVMKHMQPVYLVVTCFLDISSTPEKSMRVLAVEIFLLYCFGESQEGQVADGAFISL